MVSQSVTAVGHKSCQRSRPFWAQSCWRGPPYSFANLFSFLWCPCCVFTQPSAHACLPTIPAAQGKCVIIDLGMVVKVPLRANGLPIKISPSRDWPGRCGKMLYLAPEILNPVVSFDPLALDMWAVGVMMFVLLTGVPPWDVETGPSPADQRFALVQNGRLIDLLTAWNFTDLSASCVDLMQSFLRADPNTRFTIAQARNHVWYTTMHAQVPVATQAAAPGTF
mmetsp:Transcript_15615/g.27919  ORF Transcript_15615/g.27919 Transcript_15615/m.27919 type:complete len:223 (-) Transcript_15615:321-989(-)